MNEQMELPVNSSPELTSIRGIVITPSWSGLLQQLRHLAQFGSGVHVVHGVFGSGKSTLLKLLTQSSEEPLFASVDAREAKDVESLLRSVFDALDISLGESPTLGESISHLRGYVQHLEKDQARVAIAVDNAHKLDDSALAALISVLQGSPNTGFGLHWLFLGEPGLVNRLDQLQLLDVSISDVTIPNFSPSELKTLFNEAHKSKRLPVNVPVDQVQKYWVQSGGLPGMALAIAERAVEQKEAKSLLARSWPLSHIAAVFILVMVLLWAVLVRDKDSSSLKDAQVERKVVPVEILNDNSQSQNSEVTALDPTSSIEDSAPELDTPEAPQQDSAPNTSPEQQTAAEEDISEPELTKTESEPVAPESTSSKNKYLGVNLERYSDDEKGNSASPSESTDTPENAGQKKSVEDVDNSKATKPTTSEERLASDRQRLLGLPSNSFVLQLMATSALDTLYQYLDAQPNRSNLSVYQRVRNGKRLYILVEGFYDDKSAAQMAIANLPEKQRKGGPWPKHVGQIHDEIRQNNAN